MGNRFNHATLRFLLVGLLLFAQQAALTHEAEHAHDHEAPSQQSEDGKHFHSGLCAFHAALAGMLGAVNSPLVVPCVLSQQFERDIALEPPFFSAPSLIRGARGPPAFPILL